MHTIINAAVDRIENNIAVLIDDDENIYHVLLNDYNFLVSEGDIFISELDDSGKLILIKKNTDEMKSRKERINNLFNKLKNKNKSND